MQLRTTIVALALSGLMIGGSPVTGATAPQSAAASPMPSPASDSGDDDFCAIDLDVRPLDGAHTRYVIYLGALQSGIASGTMSLYARDARYDIVFHDAVAVGLHDYKVQPTPIVVRFSTPTTLDGAYISALAGPGGGACRIPFAPWTLGASGRNFAAGPFGTATAKSAREAVPTIDPIEAPAPVHDPRPCTEPDRVATTLTTFEPENYATLGGERVDVTVLVLLDQFDHVAGTKIDVSSGARDLDAGAVEAAAKSTYRGATFRCRPMISAYSFIVTFVGR